MKKKQHSAWTSLMLAFMLGWVTVYATGGLDHPLLAAQSGGQYGGKNPVTVAGAVYGEDASVTVADTVYIDGETELIAADAQWRYLDDGSDPGSAWRAPDYDDAVWQTGAAPLGYNRHNAGLGTVIGYGADSGDKHLASYFRHTFQAGHTAEVQTLTASLVRDDGAVVYLNGEEVYRVNMPQGEIGYRTPASGAVGDERPEEAFSIDPALLVEGENVLTAEVHQNAGTSSDLHFQLSLQASDEEPQVTVEPPIAIAMSLYGDPKTQRSFAWYTRYDPQTAPADALDSIVEVVPAGADFDSDAVMVYEGDAQVLTNLKITHSETGSFVSHKVVVDGLTPGTAYQYRLGSVDNWSPIGRIVTEGEAETTYELLYMTDSQGGNSYDYEVWADTLAQGLDHFPDARFLMMAGDQVDAGALEYQWLDFFGKPQADLLNLPIQASVGNHEGPYNNNFSYHFNYPTDAVEDQLPAGSVYAFDYGDAHFMVLNTMDMGWDDRQRESFRQQVEWLRREVAETDRKWKVLMMHKAIYSVGGHTNDGDILELRRDFHGVIDELGIDVVLQGHDHTFMRSHQMYGDEPVTQVETDESGAVRNPDGTLYMVSNAVGTKYYDVRSGIDHYYAAVMEQPRKPVFSGIRMTPDSLTIDSYRSGEDEPFDTYTIRRDDARPQPVRALTAGATGDGRIQLSWLAPKQAGASADDPVRGYRIVEQSGQLGRNWSLYVPAEGGRSDYAQLIDAPADSGQVYSFAVTAVDNRDNSETARASVDGQVPAAPTAAVVHDGFNTLGWTAVPGYAAPSAYEYSVDGGASWQPVTAHPQPVGDGEYPAGEVQVRVQAAGGMQAGHVLATGQAYTRNSVHDAFALEATLKRADDTLIVRATAEQTALYDGEAQLVVQLMDGDTPLLLHGVPVEGKRTSVEERFAVSGADYRVKVFVFDERVGGAEMAEYLAQPLVLE
ncbi:metallophosphoesterase [Paenibacillus sp. IB182496]|uniref:Metallophosphoesterase n=1 Tax=Paenibacillus sabuli TaxID=2772509 RepID=A0A927BZR9_9BACL|nr:metallophosphoesterase [Paenibacillus sabuli]MBD2848494.1 metallophosphoesterase [Paenibacillus sabuli]